MNNRRRSGQEMARREVFFRKPYSAARGTLVSTVTTNTHVTCSSVGYLIIKLLRNPMRKKLKAD